MIFLLGYIGAIAMGILLGILGGGGSILTIPILVYLLKVPEATATSYSLLVVGSTAWVSGFKYLRQKQVSLPAVFSFGIPSIFGVILSQTQLQPLLPDPVFSVGSLVISKGMTIMMVFALLMLLASQSMIRGRKGGDAAPTVAKTHPLLLVGLGLATGLVSGFVGAGGGFIIIPVLVHFAHIPIRMAIGTSLSIIALNSTFGFIGAWIRGMDPNWTLLIPFTFLSIGGALVGVGLSEKIPAAKLRPAFGWFVLLMGIFIIFKTLLK